jgi:cellulose synthase (UDP-forming)
VLAVVSSAAALLYLKWLFFDARPENLVLFYLLVVAEVFNIAQAAGFWLTIWRQRWTEPTTPDFTSSDETVDIFITVAGEPADIVERTLRGALGIRHPRMSVWVLDDGRSPEIESMAGRYGAGYLTRPDRRGAKAGNVNEAMKRTSGDFIVIFDADHVPSPEFLERTMGAFDGERVSFVQTPQYYGNRTINRVAAGAYEQQELFYGPIMRGRNALGAVFSCGTNVVFRRAALDDVGGMPEDSITEDMRVSLELLRRGWRSEYVPVVLAQGLGPVDVSGYFGQQLRWARGGLEILFRRRPFFRGMRLGTALEYGFSFMYWFTGLAYAAYLVLPVAYLVFGLRPVQAPNQYPVYFLPYIFSTLVTLAYASDFTVTFRALWFTLASFPVHLWALASALTGRAARFVITPKTAGAATLRPVVVHVAVMVVLAAAGVAGSAVRGLTPAVLNNVAFAMGHVLIVQGFVRYALRPDKSRGDEATGGRSDAG